MSKKNLVDHVSQTTDWTQKDAQKAIDAVLEGMKHEIQTNQKLSLVGFGSFDVYWKKPQQSRNPRTGEPVHVPGRNNLRFKPSDNFTKTLQNES